MSSTHIEFKNSRGQKIAGIITHPEDVEHDDDSVQRPGVILCHSFTGYKEIPHLKALADKAASRGIVALRFDFTDCVGESEGSCEDMKLSSQIEDLKDAIRYFESRGEVDPDSIGLAGHSLGGMTSIFVASELKSAEAVVPIAAPASSDEEKLFQGNEIERWRQAGHIHFPTQKRGEIKIGWQFYKDLQQYDAREVVSEISAPVRFVHGTEDEIVPLNNSKEMYERAVEPKSLKDIKGADHLFRKKENQEEMVEETLSWIEEYV